MDNCRGASAEIDIAAFRHNLAAIRAITGGKKILAAVKADAYGHGAVALSRVCEQERLCEYLGVASIEEGIELRQAGISLPILILGLFIPTESCIDALFSFNLTPTVADADTISNIARKAVAAKKRQPVHLKVDTGMGRIGCSPDEALVLARTIAGESSLLLEGVFSHMPLSDEPANAFNTAQIKDFSRVVITLKAEFPDIIAHLANSGAILNFPSSHFDMVRPGIICYGYPPSAQCKAADLIPVMTLKSRVIFTKQVKKGVPLSYGHLYSTERDTTISTIAIGYADGYNRLLSNRGTVSIRNKHYPVVGRVCMDQILVDTGSDVYLPGEKVTLFGTGEITAQTVADQISSIAYEVTCNISKRIPREYF